MNNLVVKEYLGNGIEFELVNGCVYANATVMCQTFSKQPKDWLKNTQTQRYIEALKQKENSPFDLVKVKHGGINNGTWIHEKLILKLAQWLNVEFELWCDEQIATLLREGKTIIKDSYMIDDPVERAKRWIEEQEEKRKAISMTTRVIEAVKNNFGSNKVAWSVAEVAKSYSFKDMGRNNLFGYMKGIGWLCKNNEPVQTQVNLGRLTSELRTDRKRDESYSVTLMTTKGILALYDRMVADGYKTVVSRKEIENMYV